MGRFVLIICYPVVDCRLLWIGTAAFCEARLDQAAHVVAVLHRSRFQMHRSFVAGSNLSLAAARHIAPSCSNSATHLRSASCHPQRSLITSCVPVLTRSASVMVTRPVAAPKAARAAASDGGAVHHASGKDFDVVVWGATGFVGQLVCEELASKYARVSVPSSIDSRAQLRSPRAPPPPSLRACPAGLVSQSPDVVAPCNSRTSAGRWPAVRRRSWSPCVRALGSSTRDPRCAARPADMLTDPRHATQHMSGTCTAQSGLPRPSPVMNPYPVMRPGPHSQPATKWAIVLPQHALVSSPAMHCDGRMCPSWSPTSPIRRRWIP